MTLPLQKPADGYLRLSYSGQAGVVGTNTQSWDLSAIPKVVRSQPSFTRRFLIFARPLSAGLLDVNAAVSFNVDSDGIPSELVLTISAMLATDAVALDIWFLHSILGAAALASQVYFLPAAPGMSGVKYRFFEAETNGSDSGHRIRNIGAAGDFDFNFEVPPDFGSLVSLEMWGASRTADNPAAPITLTSSYGVAPAGPQANSTVNGVTPAFVSGQLFQYDISSVFGALAANAQAAVNVDHGGIGGSVDYYGIMLGYL